MDAFGKLVVGAAIVQDGRLLAAQRAEPEALRGGWEFPGGKVDPGESDLDALVREYQEAVKAAIDREQDPRQRIRATIRAFTEVVAQRQDDILLLYQEVHSLERSLRRKLLARTHEFFEDVAKIVARAAAEGVIAPPDVYFATQVITFLPAMIALRRWDMRDRIAPADGMAWIVDFIMRGLDHTSETPPGRPRPRRTRRTATRATQIARGRGGRWT